MFLSVTFKFVVSNSVVVPLTVRLPDTARLPVTDAPVADVSNFF